VKQCGDADDAECAKEQWLLQEGNSWPEESGSPKESVDATTSKSQLLRRFG
jgi:hypothetical protein